MLETTLALATIVRSLEIRSVDEDFPVAVPFTTVADGPIRATRAPRELDALEQHRLFERQPREDRPPRPFTDGAASAFGITRGSVSSNVLP